MKNTPYQKRLAFLYGPNTAADLARRIEALAAQYRQRKPAAPAAPWSEKDAMLFTYGDTLVEPRRAPLRVLREFLNGCVGNAVSFLHLLPFYPYTSDDGFAVTDFRTVREDLGDWQDIEALAGDYRLVFDAVINHVSASSIYMQRYAAGDPAYADFFIELDPAADTSSVLRTRNLPLLHPYNTRAGQKWLWTTFGPDQVDLNYANPEVLLEVLDVLLFYASRGAAVLRLDAIPYLWKELGTSCAHLPQTHALIKLIRDALDLAFPQTLILTETNCPHEENTAYFGADGDEAQMIYNFTLAPLILHAIVRGEAGTLADWARGVNKVGNRATYLNVTATHDGIGMRPTEGILDEKERRMLCDLARRRGGDITGKQNADGSVSVYELNIAYFDALNDPAANEPEDLQIERFMLSQTIVLSFIGIPGIYIHSLLGSRNNTAGVAETGRARTINRAQLDRDELEQSLRGYSLRARVFTEYLRRLNIRRRQSAFHPDAGQSVLQLDPRIFAVSRNNRKTGQSILALHNVSAQTLPLDTARLPEPGPWRDLLEEAQQSHGRLTPLEMRPYQCRWLTPMQPV